MNGYYPTIASRHVIVLIQLLILLSMILAYPVSAAVTVQVDVDGSLKAPQFITSEIKNAANNSKLQDHVRVKLSISGKGEPQSYHIEKSENTISVVGSDVAGLTYGGLDVAESLRFGTLANLKSGDHKPFIAGRGIKFDIPLDVRTPSYADAGDSFQNNMLEIWSVSFWENFLNDMARHRYNILTLWSLNPFPSLIKVPEFPDIALDDVMQGNRNLFDREYPHQQLKDKNSMHNGMTDAQRFAMALKSAKVIKKMTIDEKIVFWNTVIRMAKDRGIDVYWFVWNTFVWTEEGRDGISEAKPDGVMLNYFRDSVRELVKTYPLLAGIGITAGENMQEKMGSLSKEEWLRKTYGDGIEDALKDQPQRDFRLIHRLHEDKPSAVLKSWESYSKPFCFSFKYALDHAYGVTNPPYIQKLLPVLSPKLRTWLTVWNGDVLSFRWADPDFVRNFILNIPPPDKTAGFYMGSDSYCWGREDMSTEPESPRQLVFDKQWLSFMLWGRLSYDPTLSNQYFTEAVASRFPGAPADRLMEGWTAASRIFPEITRFFWGKKDYEWYPEACLQRTGFHSVSDFMKGSGMPDEGDVTISQWQDRLLNHRPMNGTTPLEVSSHLQEDALTAKKVVDELRPYQGEDKELRLTLGDIEAFSDLGFYYAEKIAGACDLALFDKTGDPTHQTAAIHHLELALQHWKDYSEVYVRQYRQPMRFGRIGFVDIPKLVTNVEEDIQIAKNWGTSKKK